LVRAASTTIAVPCWSSWKTGMSSDSRNRASTSKQRGAAMSSRLIPPKPGAIISTARTISSVSWLARQIGQASMPAKRLNSAALPSMTGQGRTRPDVAEAEHRRPVGHDRHGVALDGQLAHVLGVVGQRHRDPAHTRGVGHREVVTGAERHLGRHLDLAADVQQERAVGDLVHGHALDRLDLVDDGLAVLGVLCGAGDVDDQPVVARLGHVHRGHDAAGLRDGRGDGADHPGIGVRVQPHGDRVRRSGGAHGTNLERRHGRGQAPRAARAGRHR
jgi:hypothetical protein